MQSTTNHLEYSLNAYFNDADALKFKSNMEEQERLDFDAYKAFYNFTPTQIPTLIVRAYKPKDLKDIIDICVIDCFNHINSVYMGEILNAFKNVDSKSRMQDSYGNIGHALVIKNKKLRRIEGFVQFNIFPKIHQMEIALMATRSSLRRKGYGSLLLSCLVKRSIRFNFKEVKLAATSKSLEFYLRLGFQPNLDAFSQKAWNTLTIEQKVIDCELNVDKELSINLQNKAITSTFLKKVSDFLLKDPYLSIRIS